MRLDVPALKKKSILQKKKEETVECEQEKQKVEDSKHIYVQGFCVLNLKIIRQLF